MARVVIVSEILNDSVAQLILGLYQQRQDVLFITGQSQRGPVLDSLRPHVQVMTPFKKWNAFEVPRSLQPISQFAPDVWHFVFANSDSLPTFAHWMLAAFARTIPRQILIASLLQEGLWKSSFRKAHLQLFDALTFSTRMQMMRFKREKGIPRHCLTEVLMPSPTPFQMDESVKELTNNIRYEVKDLAKHLKPFVLFVGSVQVEHLQELDVAARLIQETRFLLQGQRPKYMEHLHFAPHLSNAEMVFLAESAKGIVTAFGDFSMEEIKYYWSLADRASIPILASPEQAERVPGFCIPGKTGWVLQDDIKSLREVLLENPQLLLKKEPATTRHDFSDHSFNQLIRLYHKAYEKRWA